MDDSFTEMLLTAGQRVKIVVPGGVVWVTVLREEYGLDTLITIMDNPLKAPLFNAVLRCPPSPVPRPRKG